MANLKSIGKYKLTRKIGAGGFGAVYLAEDTRLGGEVALKVIHRHISDNPAFRRRFFEEIKTARNLGHHPNLIPIQDSDEVDGTLFLTMPFIEGRTLRQRFRDEGKFTLDALLPILTQLATGLNLIHGKNVVHCDVKPENIMLTREESDLQVILLDFGLVRSLDSSVDLTKTQGILGSAAYISPEQVNPALGKISPLSDVYALGVMTYELLTGAPPFDGAEKDFVAVWHDHGYTEPPPPPGLAEPIAAILLRALAKRPADRFPGAKALVEALAQVQTGRQLQAAEETELTGLLERGRTVYEKKDWVALNELVSRILKLDEGNPEAMGWLDEANAGIKRNSQQEAERKRLKKLYTDGETALKNGHWSDAVTAFTSVLEKTPGFKEAQDKLTHARTELACAESYDQAVNYTEKEDWPEACRTWLAVLENHLDYRKYDAARRLLPAVKGLLGQVTRLQGKLTDQQKDFQQIHRKQKEEAKQLQDILELYDALILNYAEQNWPAVAEGCRKVLTLVPGSAYLPHWLEQAQTELAKPKPKPQPAPPADQMTWPKDGKAMVRVPAGGFMYGDDKKPKTLPEYWIDQTPVTNAEFARFAQATGYKTTAEKEGFGWIYNFQKNEVEQPKGADWQHPGGPQTTIKEKMDHPVVQVSWHDAVAYAEWAGKRLPTEEEWEKAARGTDGRKYPWGDAAPTDKLCNFTMNVKDTTPVGKYSPPGDSPYKCADMSGNVWEWTASDYDNSRKVLRGGSWFNSVEFVRAANRDSNRPDERYYGVGFRCVVSQANGS